MPPLTETRIRATKPAEKPAKLFDGGGLYLLVNPAKATDESGARLWRLKYRIGGREKLLSLGAYPDVPLKLAREGREKARKQLAAGIDPSSARKAEKAARADTFAAIALEWLDLQRKKMAAATLQKAEWTFKDLINPYIGSRPIGSITAPEILAVLRRIETRGKHETAHRTKQRCSQIFRYAIATGRAERDPTPDLRGALAPVVVTNRAAITTPARIGELLRAIEGYSGQPSTEYALKLAPLLFARPGELRAALWNEFDLDGAEWRIPATRMKMREEHVVPLARQAVELLRELHPLTGPDGYLFPSLTTPTRPISNNTINGALRRLGYARTEMTAHGFRAMASTCLNEQGFAPDVIELQLAHAERDKVRGAYNRAARLPERRKMMQAWADYLDGLRADVAKIANIAAGRK
jgi:integrase